MRQGNVRYAMKLNNTGIGLINSLSSESSKIPFN